MILTPPVPDPELYRLIWRLDLESLRLFAKVCQEGSIIKVATIEGTSASRISKRLSAIEELVQAEVLLRTPTGYQPTETGKNLLICWESIFSAASTGLLLETGPISVKLAVAQAQRRDLDRDFGLTSLCAMNLNGQELEVLELRHPWGWAEGVSADAALWCETSAPPSATEEAISIGLTAQLRFSMPSCLAVGHVSHDLASQQQVDEFSLQHESIISVAGANFVSAQAKAFTSPSQEKWSGGVASALQHLSDNPAHLLLCLPVSARWLLGLHPHVKRLDLSPQLTHESWVIAHRPQQAAEALAKSVLSILTSEDLASPCSNAPISPPLKKQ